MKSYLASLASGTMSFNETCLLKVEKFKRPKLFCLMARTQVHFPLNIVLITTGFKILSLHLSTETKA